MLALALFAMPAFAAARPPSLTVEAEEAVATCLPPNNGAGPTWDYGAPMVVRRADRVFVSCMEARPDLEPYCNTRPRLFLRDATAGWREVWAPQDFLEREPCPIFSFGESVFVSTNPLHDASKSRSGRCDPGIVRLPLSAPFTPAAEVPVFAPGAQFAQHSYRAACVDPYTGSALVFHIDNGTAAEDYFISQRLPSGEWVPRGTLHFPIRACYPETCLRGGAAHVFAVGDIVEPVAAWRAYKFEQTKREWDYVFRRLFYAWTPDIASKPFDRPLEIDNLDATAGYMLNLDLYVDPSGAAHLLYIKSPVQSAMMRDRFFPGLKITRSLEYVVVRDGKVALRRTLALGGEGLESEEPQWCARFHVLPGGHLLVLYEATDWAASPARQVWRLLQVSPEVTPAVTVPLTEGMPQFFTASERGGSRPSQTIDIFGVGTDGQTLRYARVRLHALPPSRPRTRGSLRRGGKPSANSGG